MLRLNQATSQDLDLLFKWRNDPLIYQHANNPFEVSYEDHTRWFNNYLKKEDNLMLIASWAGVPCGMVRYDKVDKGEYEVSVYLDPAFFGKGLGLQLLEQSEKVLKEKLPVDTIRATVKNENSASLKLFQKASYLPAVQIFKKKI